MIRRTVPHGFGHIKLGESHQILPTNTGMGSDAQLASCSHPPSRANFDISHSSRVSLEHKAFRTFVDKVSKKATGPVNLR